MSNNKINSEMFEYISTLIQWIKVWSTLRIGHLGCITKIVPTEYDVIIHRKAHDCHIFMSLQHSEECSYGDNTE